MKPVPISLWIVILNRSTLNLTENILGLFNWWLTLQVQPFHKKHLKHKPTYVQTSALRGSPALISPSNKLLNHCGESHFCSWHKGLIGWLRKAVSPHPALSRGRKTQKHRSITTFVRSLLTTENHLHLPGAKRHKRNQRETAIFTRLTSLLSADVQFWKRISWVGQNLSGD